MGGREPSPTLMATHVDPQTKQSDPNANPGKRPLIVRFVIVKPRILEVGYVTSYN